MNLKNYEKAGLIVLIIILISITFLTKYNGSTDVGDYADTAKFFADKYSADLRSSHSLLYGLVHSPFVSFFNNFIIFKVTSIICLLLIMYSVYILSRKNKKALWLAVLSPIIWYMGPWINPIQLCSLLFLWAYYFIKKYRENEKIKYLLLSGILLGLSWAFWDAILFFALIFLFSFFYDKKLLHLIYFLMALFIGLLPKLIMDQLAFGFAFSGIIRYFFGIIASTFFKGIYLDRPGLEILPKLITFLFLPIFSWKLLSKIYWRNNRSLFIFTLLSLLLLLENSQIRYCLLLAPIFILELSPLISKKQFKIGLILSSLLIIFLSFPYIIQINYSTNAQEFGSLVKNMGNINFYEDNSRILEEDINSIAEDFPNQTFIVGNLQDDYQRLADVYWGDKIKEFVSIEDYNLAMKNQTIIFQKTMALRPIINERRQIFISGGIGRNEKDRTNFASIDYAIGLGKPVVLENFVFIKKYNNLYLSRKY